MLPLTVGYVFTILLAPPTPLQSSMGINFFGQAVQNHQTSLRGTQKANPCRQNMGPEAS